MRYVRIIGVVLVLCAISGVLLEASLVPALAHNRHPGHPSRPGGHSGTGIPVKNGPLTTAQVTAWVTTHQFIGGPVVGGGYPTLVSIQEMTVQQVSTLLHDALVEPNPNALVFYVVLHGPFVLENVSLPPGTQPPTVSNVFEVFDATTARVIVLGAA